MSKSPFTALWLVLLTVVLGLISALMLKKAALTVSLAASQLLLLILVVAALNGGRFLIWGYLHKHYPLSYSYPLNSLFFPAILVMGYCFGERLELTQFIGVILITAGIAILSYENRVDIRDEKPTRKVAQAENVRE